MNVIEAGRQTRPDVTWEVIDSIYDTGCHPENWPNLFEALVHVLCVEDCEGESDLRTTLVRHLGNAVRLNTHINQQLSVEHSIGPLLANLSFPTLVVDARCRVVYAGHQYSDVMLADSGLRIVDGVLHCADERVRQMIARVATNVGSPCLECLGERGGYSAYAMSLRVEREHGLAMIAWFDEEDRTNRQARECVSAFGLTPAEAGLLDGLLAGMTNTALAKERGLSPHTVQSHIKHIFAKVGVNSRTALVHKVLCGTELMSRLVGSPRERLYCTSQDDPGKNQVFVNHDGEIGYAEYGSLQGQPILLIHNISGSRFQIPVSEMQLAAQGVRLIVPDRPGIGLSSRPEGDAVEYFAAAVPDLLDHLGIPSATLIGHSVGAIYALEVARCSPGKISDLILASPMTHMSDEDLADLNDDMRKTVELARQDVEVARQALTLQMCDDPRHLLDRMVASLPECDQILYRDARFYQMAIDALSENVRRGAEAMVEDLLLLSDPWRCDPSDVCVPVTVWHGELDITSPLVSVRRLVGALPAGVLHTIPNETHNLLFRHWHTIVGQLLGESLA